MKNVRPERGLVPSSQLRSGIVTDETSAIVFLKERFLSRDKVQQSKQEFIGGPKI